MVLELDEVQETNRVVRLQFSKAPSARGVSAATFGEPPPPAYSPNATKKLMLSSTAGQEAVFLFL